MTGAVPKVAVIGRQNVGKSTLVNRLFGKRTAIAHEMPGVTRDRLELQTTWGGRTFALVDTAGYLPHARGIEALAADQAARAMAEADVILLVVDVQTGITEDDAALVRRLRTAEVPVLLVANKADSPKDVADVAGLYRLGLGEPVVGVRPARTGDRRPARPRGPDSCRSRPRSARSPRSGDS